MFFFLQALNWHPKVQGSLLGIKSLNNFPGNLPFKVGRKKLTPPPQLYHRLLLLPLLPKPQYFQCSQGSTITHFGKSVLAQEEAGSLKY